MRGIENNKPKFQHNGGLTDSIGEQLNCNWPRHSSLVVIPDRGPLLSVTMVPVVAKKILVVQYLHFLSKIDLKKGFHEPRGLQ